MSPKSKNKNRKKTVRRPGDHRPSAGGPSQPKFVPVVVDETPDDEMEMVTIFTYRKNDGEDIEYQIPKDPDAGVGISYLEDQAVYGEHFAGAELMKRLMGDDTWEDLKVMKGLKGEALQQIIENCLAISLGALESKEQEDEGKAEEESEEELESASG